MSFMTTKLRYVVEQALDDKLLEHDEANWPAIADTLGLADYPVYDSATGKVTQGACADRDRINAKLIRHYYMREIGLETVGLFRWYLRESMFLIMDRYNPLYESLSFLTDPMGGYTDTETEGMEEGHTEQRDTSRNAKEAEGTGENTVDSAVEKSVENEETSSTSTTTDTADGTTSSTNIFSNTPENMIPTGAVKNLQYATTVTYDDGTTHDESSSRTEASGTRSLDSSRDSERNVTKDTDRSLTRDETEGVSTGYEGNRTTKRTREWDDLTQMERIKQYRELEFNIDRMVIEDEAVAECFMLIYE